MPEPIINLFNISRNEFRNGFITALIRLIEENSNNPVKNYYMIRLPEYSNQGIPNENIHNLTDLNMECTSVYHYWYLVNSSIVDENTGSYEDLLYNYEEIATQVRDYIDYPEIRTIRLNVKRLKYDYREIVKLIMNDFKFYILQLHRDETAEV